MARRNGNVEKAVQNAERSGGGLLPPMRALLRLMTRQIVMTMGDIRLLQRGMVMSGSGALAPGLGVL
jgi:hypothetical protein